MSTGSRSSLFPSRCTAPPSILVNVELTIFLEQHPARELCTHHNCKSSRAPHQYNLHPAHIDPLHQLSASGPSFKRRSRRRLTRRASINPLSWLHLTLPCPSLGYCESSHGCICPVGLAKTPLARSPCAPTPSSRAGWVPASDRVRSPARLNLKLRECRRQADCLRSNTDAGSAQRPTPAVAPSTSRDGKT